MRATSLPTALSVAAAALALAAAVLAPLAVPSTALAERWLRPAPGEVARPFAYDRGVPFTAGAHRGADLGAPPGTPVRAACAGRVIHAGAVAGRDEVVSVRCGTRRVSYLPLADVAVAEAEHVRAGALLATVAAGHGGLHVGVRREGDPFGYEDPMALLPGPGKPFPSTPRPPTPRLAPRPPAARPAPRPSTPRLAPRPPSARPAPRPSTPRLAPRPPAARPAPRPSTPWRPPPTPRHVPSSSPAPWPVWAGLALLLAGAAGSGTIVARRRVVRRRGTATAAPARVGY